MTDPRTVIERWATALPDPATWERVHADLFYVRLPGTARRWIPIEIEVGERTLKLTSHVIIEPDDRRADVYAFLLRRNHQAKGVAFSLDGKEGVICLVTRIAREACDEGQLDLLAGRVVEETEQTFRSILELGFAARLRRGTG